MFAHARASVCVFLCVCMCVCVCVRTRERVYVCVRVCAYVRANENLNSMYRVFPNSWHKRPIRTAPPTRTPVFSQPNMPFVIKYLHTSQTFTESSTGLIAANHNAIHSPPPRRTRLMQFCPISLSKVLSAETIH